MDHLQKNEEVIERVKLTPEYSISRIIKGGWHLAGGHGSVSESKAISDMLSFVEAGITTFDCADIYTGVEQLIGRFLQKEKDAFLSGALTPVQVHTKYVPDYDALSQLTSEHTTKIIDRSLMRLGVERLDLVQFAWWDYSVPGYIETALHLSQLQREGKIRLIGVTNFDAARIAEMLDAGVIIATNQVQYSVLDQRVDADIHEGSNAHEIPRLCYGTVAGGFLSDRYLLQPDPIPPLENRSLTKYRLIIDEYGGYDQFQLVLSALRDIADKYGVGIAEIACRYILQKDHVASLIIGARNTAHLPKLKSLFQFSLDQEEMEMIDTLKSGNSGPNGPFYELERDKTGKHGSIMKYNLNSD